MNFYDRHKLRSARLPIAPAVSDQRGTFVRAAAKPPIEAGLKLEYSNYGYGLLALVIEKITGQSYLYWIEANVVRAAALRRDDAGLRAEPQWRSHGQGHSADLVLGRRVVAPGENLTNGFAPATGSAAADLTRFFSQLVGRSGEFRRILVRRGIRPGRAVDRVGRLSQRSLRRVGE